MMPWRRQEAGSNWQNLRGLARIAIKLASVMNELINLIVQKTGISQQNAQQAAQTVVEFLKKKMPAPMAAQLDSLLAGGTGGVMNTMTEKAGGFLKGKVGSLVGSAK